MDKEKENQVAVVAPTTLLAKQHAEVFEKRMSSFGFKVHHISRLTPKKQIDQIKKEIEDGTAKLIVGTHTILNLKFKKLAA